MCKITRIEKKPISKGPSIRRLVSESALLECSIPLFNEKYMNPNISDLNNLFCAVKSFYRIFDNVNLAILAIKAHIADPLQVWSIRVNKEDIRLQVIQ